MSDRKRFGVLDAIEWIGNRLPEPAALFLIGCLIVMVLSHLGQVAGWTVQTVTPRRAEGGGIELVETGAPITAVSLLDKEGIYWCVSNMVGNFIRFPPLGIILVGMLGVGIAERCGLIGAMLKALMLVAPRPLLTPIVVFLGVNSSLATDAGYIVLPPLAAALFLAAGRSPVVGVAAVFAGIGAGFSANLSITSLDPLLTSLTDNAAKIIDPTIAVPATCNWWFMIGSTFLLTLVGWGVTAWFVEPRFESRGFDDGGPPPHGRVEVIEGLTSVEARGLMAALAVLLVVLGAFAALVFVPGAPLNGPQAPDPSRPGVTPPHRWEPAVVPLILVGFGLPGVAYGRISGSTRNHRDVVRLMVEAMISMAPVIVLCFFAGQFIEYFKHSNLGGMLAMVGGKALAASGLSRSVLLVAFIAVVMAFNLLMASASAKWTLLAPIFVPMFMFVGIHPALTQGAYRVGDSCTNIVTPLNAYLIIILEVVRRYAPRSGMGTLVSMMLPYSIVFAIVWTAFLLVWIAAGRELGPGGPLHYLPPE